MTSSFSLIAEIEEAESEEEDEKVERGGFACAVLVDRGRGGLTGLPYWKIAKPVGSLCICDGWNPRLLNGCTRYVGAAEEEEEEAEEEMEMLGPAAAVAITDEVEGEEDEFGR